MEKNKRNPGWKFYLAEGLLLAAATGGMWLLGTVRGQESDVLLGNCVMALFAAAVSCFHFRREYRDDRLDYDNGQHALRFLACFGIALAVSFLCGFLPVEGWPYLLIFVMLSLFSDMSTGILASSSLLLVSVLLNGASVGAFALYLVSGMFAVTMFRHLEREFKIGTPMFLSLFCLLVCETAEVVLTENARPDVEMFVIPAGNMIISSILLLWCLKLFSSMVIYRYREKYLELNDTENPVLAALRQENRQNYVHCIHTAYFCERIGQRLELDVDALKCAAYYCGQGEAFLQQMEENDFPPAVKKILGEYWHEKQGYALPETAVLVCADSVVSSITYLLSRQQQVDYDKIIDAIFKKLYEDGSFDRCRITLQDLFTMRRIFKEEKLYYDFLR